MKINIGDTVADKDKLTGEITLGTVTAVEQNWTSLFQIEWEGKGVWRVKKEVAIELRQNFLDTLTK